MLVNMNDVLKPAQKGKYAVGLFNAVNLELARGIIAAAEQTIITLGSFFLCIFLIIVIASDALPPVASIGSTTISVLSCASEGNLQ